MEDAPRTKEQLIEELNELRQRVADLEVTQQQPFQPEIASSYQHNSLIQFLDLSMDAIVSIDQDQAILIFNKGAEEVFGYRREEVVGRQVDILLPLDIVGAHPAHLEKFAESSISSRYMDERGVLNVRGRRKDSTEFPAEASISKFSIAKQMIFTVFLRDITERKEAEATRHELALLEERNRIARDIHDSIAQGLTGVIWQLNALEQAIRTGEGQVLDTLERIKNLTKESLQQVRRAVWDLRVGAPEGMSLAEALRREAEKLIGNGEIHILVNVDGEERVLPSSAETALTRICQEALINILKYAQATEVGITVAYDDLNVQLTVQDNGIGFDPEQPSKAVGEGGFGLISMRERARLLDGTLILESSPGQGTLVKAILPLE